MVESFQNNGVPVRRLKYALFTILSFVLLLFLFFMPSCAAAKQPKNDSPAVAQPSAKPSGSSEKKEAEKKEKEASDDLKALKPKDIIDYFGEEDDPEKLRQKKISKLPETDQRRYRLADAVMKGNTKTVLQILEKYPETVNQTDGRDKTALHCACMCQDVEMVKLLVEKGAKVNSAGNDGSTPLHIACTLGKVKVVRYLLEHGAQVNVKISREVESFGLFTPLHLAADTCSEKKDPENAPVYREIAGILLDHGAATGERDTLNRTPLTVALTNGNKEMARYLVKRGSVVTILDAAALGDVETVRKELKANPSQANSKDGEHVSVLHYAAEGGSPEIVTMLIDKGADVNAQEDVLNLTPLQFAIGSQNIEIIKILLERGATTEGDPNNLQPIHVAVKLGNIEMVKLLIKHGADVNATFDEDVTPLSIAEEENLTEIIKFLKEKGAK